MVDQKTSGSHPTADPVTIPEFLWNVENKLPNVLLKITVS